MSEPKSQESRALECPRCGFVLPLVIPLPAWCPLCDEDHPSQLRERARAVAEEDIGGGGVTEVITAPDRAKARHDSQIFLAGGITGTHEWQREVIKLLDGVGATLLNPRRAKFPKGPDVARRQIEWEFARLRDADGVMFWFPIRDQLDERTINDRRFNWIFSLHRGRQPVLSTKEPEVYNF